MLVYINPVPDLIVPAAFSMAEPLVLLPLLSLLLLVLALYAAWHFRKQVTYINRTGKESEHAHINMISNISQEVRTPLNAIIGFSEQLRYTSLDANQRELLAVIEDAALVLARMQHNIRELAWIRKGVLELDYYPFSPYEMFHDVTDQGRKLAQKKQLLFEVVFDGDQQLKVTGDGDRLARLMSLLLDNAIRYTDAGTVRCCMSVHQTTGGQVNIHFSVNDTGRGIAPELQSCLFTDHLHNYIVASGAPHGAGIGLSLAKALVDLHHGNIAVESLPGKGSTVHCNISYRLLSLPQTLIITQREAEQMATGQFMKDRYVLVADDQEMNLALMERILTRWQCRFDKATDGEVAYELFVKNKYDIILLDLQMPGMTGLEVVRRIREDKEPIKAHTPVLALTADTAIPASREFIEAGFNDYLLKPFREREIYKVIIRHLRPESASIKTML
ncbi:response regulator [Chitinophaga rhizophila]|uniref:histidine kinase n=1 Tax=Chitinophaga rhizophila TaxID=2866212 RepID=A0ABS7GM38_9BACT|nr:response regulator [Chitinophaga rhizophila]MBW8687944.1 response regulator [Chitinophaga rhizophila]